MMSREEDHSHRELVRSWVSLPCAAVMPLARWYHLLQVWGVGRSCDRKLHAPALLDLGVIDVFSDLDQIRQIIRKQKSYFEKVTLTFLSNLYPNVLY